MKKLIFTLFVCFSATFSMAQVGAVAPDFTQTDINGKTHNVYNYLSAGKVVVVDMFATWCSPCWDFHQDHYLKDLYNEFGPPGTDQLVILAYEDDQSTTLSNLQGNGALTVGDWITGIPYPVINATKELTLEYGSSYPTVSVICPTDKKIKYDLANAFGSLATMRTQIQDVINQCAPTTSINENSNKFDFTIAPNPTTSNITISFDFSSAQEATVNIFDLTGRKVSNTKTELVEGSNKIDLNLSPLPSGSYLLRIDTESQASIVKSIIKN